MNEVGISQPFLRNGPVRERATRTSTREAWYLHCFEIEFEEVGRGFVPVGAGERFACPYASERPRTGGEQ